MIDICNKRFIILWMSHVYKCYPENISRRCQLDSMSDWEMAIGRCQEVFKCSEFKNRIEIVNEININDDMWFQHL